MMMYVPRPEIDGAVDKALGSGSGVYLLSGPEGAGKSTTLLHTLAREIQRRQESRRNARAYVRLVQLYGDEPPSLVARRLLRETTYLHLRGYPDPDHLRLLIETMAQMVPYLSQAGKLLSALVPDDLRPLHEVALTALAEVGERAVTAKDGAPLILGIDVLGGNPTEPLREFFVRLCQGLPPSVILLCAQEDGQGALLPASLGTRIPVSAFRQKEAEQFLRDRVGELPADVVEILPKLSLLPGDLAQIERLYGALSDRTPGKLAKVLTQLGSDLSMRYEERYLEEAWSDPQSADICAWAAVSARSDRPLRAEDILRRLGRRGEEGWAVDLLRVRQSRLLRAFCVTGRTAILGAQGSGVLRDEEEVGFPLLLRNSQAQKGVLSALRSGGVLSLYQKRYRVELLTSLRGGGPIAQRIDDGLTLLRLLLPEGPTATGMGDGAQEEKKGDLALCVQLLSELEVLLWRGGFHRTFAEIYDMLDQELTLRSVSLRNVAPNLYFRRARARIQGVDWSSAFGAPSASDAKEVRRAIVDLSELFDLTEGELVEARAQLGLAQLTQTNDREEIGRLCQYIPKKARQARAYARILGIQHGLIDRVSESILAMDDGVFSLAAFSIAGASENLAQTLTILGDWYSICQKDAVLAERLYAEAIRAAESCTPKPAFCLGVIHRSVYLHHLRFNQARAAEESLAEARRCLLLSPDASASALLSLLTSRSAHSS